MNHHKNHFMSSEIFQTITYLYVPEILQHFNNSYLNKHFFNIFVYEKPHSMY